VTTRRATKKPRQSSKPAAATPAHSPEQAQAALAAGRFREAIEHFKALSRTGPPALWQEGLGLAYRGRALELEAKGMSKEALTIWDNRQQACPGLVPDPRHLALLLRHGRVAPALAAYRHLVNTGDAAPLTEARARFAASFLIDDLPAGFSEDPVFADDPLIRDTPTARAALAAYCAGGDEEVGRQLKAIPFRSPYRDLATLLKALIGLRDDPVASGKLVERVPADSPFAPLAKAIRLGLQPDEDLTKALGEVGEPVRDFVMTLRGWPDRRRQLWRELHRLGDNPNSSQWIALLRRYRGLLGASWLRHQVRALAAADFPRPLPAPLLAELTPFDRTLGAALIGEKTTPPRAFFGFWKDVMAAIVPPGSKPAPGSEDALRLALIQRRLGENPNLLKSTIRSWVEGELATSLELDPDYLPGHLLLIGHYRRHGRLREARPMLERLLQRWPEDAEILNEALDLALAGNAFKKAAGLAKRILDRDPINRRAKQSLFQAHLAHARKQIAKSRFDLARKELEQADGWAEGAASQARVELLRGIIAWLHGKHDKEAMSQACAALGGGITGRLALALEAERLRFSPQILLKETGLLPLPTPDREDLLAYCRALRNLVEEADFKPKLIWQPFHAPVHKAAKLDLDAADFETVCETLRQIGLAELRLEYANAALRRWPAKPLFVVHKFEARAALGKPGMDTWTQMRHLEDALVQARAEGDQRTAHRIEELLGLSGAWDPGEDFEDEEDFYDEGDDDDLPAELANMDPAVFINLLRNLMGPEFKKLEKALGGKDVLGGLRELIDAGDLPDLPPDLIKFLRQPSNPPKPQAGPQIKPQPKPRREPAPRRARQPLADPDDETPSGQLDLF